jgi:branched-chain amino acid transport system ATP-binding protein
VDKNWKHVSRITDHNLILLKGEIVFQGSSQEINSKPVILQQYLGV